jgi:hypothetical protein
MPAAGRNRNAPRPSVRIQITQSHVVCEKVKVCAILSPYKVISVKPPGGSSRRSFQVFDPTGKGMARAVE